MAGKTLQRQGCAALQRYARMLGSEAPSSARERRPWWIVADMDSTLIEHGPDKSALGDLDTSPCAAPLFEWLEAGGRLLVVTSDDGYRPFTSLWEQIPAALRANGAVCLSTSDGAALYTGDAEGAPQECAAYWEATTQTGLAAAMRERDVGDAGRMDHGDHEAHEVASHFEPGGKMVSAAQHAAQHAPPHAPPAHARP